MLQIEETRNYVDVISDIYYVEKLILIEKKFKQQLYLLLDVNTPTEKFDTIMKVIRKQNLCPIAFVNKLSDLGIFRESSGFASLVILVSVK